MLQSIGKRKSGNSLADDTANILLQDVAKLARDTGLSIHTFLGCLLIFLNC